MAMDDFDSLFEADLASINQVFQEFEIKDKRDHKRQKTEEAELKKRESKVSLCEENWERWGREIQRLRELYMGVGWGGGFCTSLTKLKEGEGER